MSENNKKNDSSIDINLSSGKKMSKRRRQMLIKHYMAVFNVCLIAFIFVAGFVYLLFFKRETVSNEENRELTKFPKFTVSSYVKGDYTQGISDWYDDTVHGRSSIKKFISSHILPLKGRKFGEDNIELYGNGTNKENSGYNGEEAVDKPAPAVTTAAKITSASTETAAETTTTVTTMPDINNPAADGEIANNIVVANNRGLMLYGGGKESGLEYAASLNAYKAALGDGVNVYSMVCPTAVSYYMPENYRNLSADEKSDIDNINSALSGVVPVDIFDTLLLHKNEAIYSRTDHHWQPLGAYYAAEKFAETANVPFADLSEYETVSLPGYVGTLYGYTKSAALINNPEDFVYYKPRINTVTTRYTTAFTEPREDSLLLDPGPMATSSYYMVFGGDGQITHVNTDCKNGRTLVIFKDSYGNALLPVLTSSFENIYLCDIRYFDLNAVSFVQQVQATDLLFAMNTFSAVGENRKFIEANRTRQVG